MNIKKYISAFLNGFFVLIVILFVLDATTSFEIKDQTIKSITYLGGLVVAPLTLIWNLLAMKSAKRKILAAILPVMALLGILIIGPLKIVFSSSAWHTQTILYQNGHLSFKKIEFQMQDVGASGYNQRTVEVTYLTHMFMIVEPVEIDLEQKVEWVKVDIDVNELDLKFP